MLNHLILSGYLFTTAFTVAYILTPLCIYFAVRLDVFDRPGIRKLHENPTPLFGGVAIFISFAVVVGFHLIIANNLVKDLDNLSMVSDFLPSYIKTFSPDYARIYIIFGGATLILIVGLVDDIVNLSVRIRFILEFIIAAVVVLVGLRPELMIGSPWLEIIAIVWIVGITNSFNLLDGADGLSCGVAVISALGLSFLLVIRGTYQPFVSLLLICFAGACAGFYPYNFPRSRAFLGSAGSMFLGYMLAVSVLISSFTNIDFLGRRVFSVPIFVLAIPLYDTFSVILIRLRRGKSIFEGDFNHLVHRLMRKGFSPHKAVLFIYLLTILTLSNAFFIIAVTPGLTVIILQVILCVVILIAIEKAQFNRKRIINDNEEGI